jgi:chaperone modulatory protein CbpM
MTMANNDTRVRLTGVILEEQVEMTLAEVSRSCAVHAQHIIELVEEGVLVPIGREQRTWRFTGGQVRRASISVAPAARLGINLAGACRARPARRAERTARTLRRNSNPD